MWFKVRESPFPWWMWAGLPGYLSRSGHGTGAPAFQAHPPLTFLNKPRAQAWLQTELFPFLSRWVSGLAEIPDGLPSLSLCFRYPGFMSRAWSSSSTAYPRSHSIPPWWMIYVRERSTATIEANQRKFLPVRAEKVHDGFSCPHFQLCLEVRFPGAVMSALSACSTGLEKALNHTGRVFGWITQRNSAQE